jgi:sugar lactone lactonase YvrE
VKTYTAQVAAQHRHLLAEGPLWDPIREQVLWVDVDCGQVHFGTLAGDAIEPGAVLTFPETVGAVVSAADGTLLVAGRRRLTTVLTSGERIAGVQLLPDNVDSRLNDGGCDPSGRFVVGSMSLDGRTAGELLCRINADGAVETIDADLTLSNGLAWSPDQRTMYSIDTASGVLWARSYDPQTGAFGVRAELFHPIEASGEDGPDGMCVDVDGNLWIAIWGQGEVRCYSPSGDVLAIVEVEAPHTSSVAFVGPERDLLMITTGSSELKPGLLEKFPKSGRLFTARVATTGVPVPYWSGFGSTGLAGV